MAKFAFLIVCTALLSDIAPRTAVTQTVSPNDPHQPKISITKCCRGQYNILTDSCQDGGDEILIGAWPPTVYSHRDNRTIVVDTEDLQLTYILARCPDAYVTKVITDFRFYDNGLLWSAPGNLKPGLFCLDQMKPAEDEPQFVARFCVIDPCSASNCIRKCCPHGMAVNSKDKTCLLYSKEFTPTTRNENDSLADMTSHWIVGEVGAPVCADGVTIDLRPDLFEEDKFHILPSGQLEMSTNSINESILDNYCVDNFVLNSEVMERAMICYTEPRIDPWALSVYSYFFTVCLIFLMMTILGFVALPEISNIHGVIIMCHVASLTTMYTSLGAIHLRDMVTVDTESKMAYVVLGVLAHFSWLSSFTWLNVMSFNIWWTFSYLIPESTELQWRLCVRLRLKSRFLAYSVYAWGVPVLIVAVGQILDYSPNLPDYIIKPNLGEANALFQDAYQLKESQITYLFGPLAVIISGNIFFFFLTALQLHRSNSNPDLSTDQTNIKSRMIFSLVVLIGVSWMMEIISFPLGGLEYIWIPTDIANIVTGIFIIIFRKLIQPKRVDENETAAIH